MKYLKFKTWFKWHLFPLPEKKIESVYEIVIYLSLLGVCIWLYQSFNGIDYREINIQAECLDDNFLKIPVSEKKVVELTPSMEIFYSIPMTTVEPLIKKQKTKANLFADFRFVKNIEDSLIQAYYKVTDSLRHQNNPRSLLSVSKKIGEKYGEDGNEIYLYLLNLYLSDQNINQIDSLKTVFTGLANDYHVDSPWGGTFYSYFEQSIINPSNNINSNIKNRFDSQYKHDKVWLADFFSRKYKGNNLVTDERYITHLHNDSSIITRTMMFDNEEIALATPSIFSLYDISQAYYSIKIKSNSIAAITLDIDFVGITDFSRMNPSPDLITKSGIIFTDPFKILKIKNKGLEFHAKFVELANRQNVRLFLLSAFMSALTTILLIFVVLSIYKVFVKEKTNGKDAKIVDGNVS